MLIKTIQSFFHKEKDADPEKAYDIWAKEYDDQPHNLMLALDELIFTDLLKNVVVKDKQVLDVGCGTGRHWAKLMLLYPAVLKGYDVSTGMLNMLRQKIPDAVAHHLKNDLLDKTNSGCIDVLISTLTIAHIANVEVAMKEWDRVLIPDADIIITDYHPAVLEKGGKRTFKHGAKTLAVKNHIHSIELLNKIGTSLGWRLIDLVERKIDEAVKHFYEQQNALDVYELFKGYPVIYGLHFKKEQ